MVEFNILKEVKQHAVSSDLIHIISDNKSNILFCLICQMFQTLQDRRNDKTWR